MSLRSRTYAEKAARRERQTAMADVRAALARMRGGPCAPAPLERPAAPTQTPLAPTVRSTTAATLCAAPKRGAAESEALLAWVRAQPCAFPRDGHDCRGPSEPHHWPTTGSNGVRLDPLVAATCRMAHDLAHAGLYSAAEQAAAVHQTMVRFWRTAPPDVRRAVLVDLLSGLI